MNTHAFLIKPHTKAERKHRLQPNGLRVLSLIPELVEQIPGKSPERLIYCSSLDGEEEILVDTVVSPQSVRERFGFPMIGVRRAEFHKLLIDTAEKHGIEIKWGHQAIQFEQSENAVEVVFANGVKDTASFVVGCDGLHSNTRTALFGKEKADFTGLAQVRACVRLVIGPWCGEVDVFFDVCSLEGCLLRRLPFKESLRL